MSIRSHGSSALAARPLASREPVQPPQRPYRVERLGSPAVFTGTAPSTSSSLLGASKKLIRPDGNESSASRGNTTRHVLAKDIAQDAAGYWFGIIGWGGLILIIAAVIAVVQTVFDDLRNIAIQREEFNVAEGLNEPAMLPDTQKMPDSPSSGPARQPSSASMPVVAQTELHKTISLNVEHGIEAVAELMPPGESVRVTFFFLVILFVIWNWYFLFYINAVFLGEYMDYQKGVGPQSLKAIKKYHFAMDSDHVFSIHTAATIALMDMLCLSALTAGWICNMRKFFLPREGEEAFDAYIGLATACERIQQMQAFSTLKMLGFVHPALIANDYKRWMANPPFGSQFSKVEVKMKQRFMFVVVRAFCGVMGFLAFGVKLTLVSDQLQNPEIPPLLKVGVLGSLLGQTLGAVLVDEMLKKELLFAIFTQNANAERCILPEVYTARIYQRIWQDYYIEGRRFDFIVLALTFDYLDLQKLVFMSDEEAKMASESAVALRSERFAHPFFREESGVVAKGGAVSRFYSAETAADDDDMQAAAHAEVPKRIS